MTRSVLRRLASPLSVAGILLNAGLLQIAATLVMPAQPAFAGGICTNSGSCVFTGTTFTGTFVDSNHITVTSSGKGKLQGATVDWSGMQGMYVWDQASSSSLATNDAGLSNSHARYNYNGQASNTQFSCIGTNGNASQNADMEVLGVNGSTVSMQVDPRLVSIADPTNPGFQAGNCMGNGVSFNINVQDPTTYGQKASDVQYYKSGNTIYATINDPSMGLQQDGSYAFTQIGSSDVYQQGSGLNSNQNCLDTIIYPANAKPDANGVVQVTYQSRYDTNGQACRGSVQSSKVLVLANTPESHAKNGNGGTLVGTPPSGGANGSAGQPDPTAACGAGDWDWFVCSAMNISMKLTTGLDNWINGEMTVQQAPIFGNNSTGNSYYEAWNTFRILGTILFVIAGLIMIMSQAMGFEILDAYTIRKTLPRLLVAIIGMSLSWPLLELVINFFNTFGQDTMGLIYVPFSHIKSHAQLTGGLLSVAFFAALIAGVAYKKVAVTIIWPVVEAGLFALLTGFIVIVFRRVAITILVILAPLAIACYALPGTKKVWDLWKDNFIGLMIMFPILMALIAAGHVFFVVAASGGAVEQVEGMIGYYIPYAMTAVVFSFARGLTGSAIGAITGASGNMQKNRQKKHAERRAAAMHEFRSGSSTNNGMLNALSARMTTRNFGFGERGQASYAHKLEAAGGEFAKSHHGMAAQFNDDVLAAKTYGSEAEARERMARDFGISGHRLDRAVAGAKASGGWGAQQQVWATKQLAATGTGYANEAQMLSTIARVSGNNQDLADSMWGEMRGLSERAGRAVDLKAGFGMGTDIIHNLQQANRQRGTAIGLADLEGDRADATLQRTFQPQFQDFTVDATRGVDGMTRARSKPRGLSNSVERLHQAAGRYQEVIDRANRGENVDPTELEAAQVSVGHIQATLENMESATHYGPEVGAEAIHGTRQTATGSAPGNLRLVPTPPPQTPARPAVPAQPAIYDDMGNLVQAAVSAQPAQPAVPAIDRDARAVGYLEAQRRARAAANAGGDVSNSAYTDTRQGGRSYISPEEMDDRSRQDAA